MSAFYRLFPFALLFGACGNTTTLSLPEPVSNNAVAYHAPTQTAYSFAGLGADKNWKSVHAKSYKCELLTKTCETITPLPDGIGRLAASAQIIGDVIYVLGGYSVDEAGEEISTPEVWAFDVTTQSYTRKADMPIPVDDSVALSFQDRYLYLISGWHKDDNVVNVQMYDTRTDIWSPASDWRGIPVFGHAGGIVDNVMVVCDGVQIIPAKSARDKRQFTEISACWRGDINAENPKEILWRKLDALPGKGNYRMAATGWVERNIVLFAGGTNNPYNYNGIGYDKIPSQPSAHVWGYDISADEYILFKDKAKPSMDHRALIHLQGNQFATFGGMGREQKILGTFNTFKVRRSPK